MKKKIAILGSTGSIGKTLFNILLKEKKNSELHLLTAHKSHKLLLKQAKALNVKNLILTNKKDYEILKEKTKNTNIRVFNNFKKLDKIFKKKIDYVMSSISGINGLEPTIKIIKFTKKIAIANKESIICGWHLIKKDLKKFKTSFIPVDSEHFSVFYSLKGNKISNIKKIYLTASGGPLINTPITKLKNIKISEAIKHPNWKMGKKISIDSATMMNKVFEIMEAKKIFNLNYESLDILIHPSSYVHAIVKFNDGMVKIIAHDTNMKIPIFNSLHNSEKKIKTDKLNIKKLNFLDLKKVDIDKFPSIKIIKQLKNNESSLETLIVLANDILVDLFLLKKIYFTDIVRLLQKLIKMKKFNNHRLKKINDINSIIFLNNQIRATINDMIK